MTVQTKKKGNFFKSIKMELKKVSWPSKKELWQYTAVVFAMCLSVGVLIAIFDFLFTYVFKFIIK